MWIFVFNQKRFSLLNSHKTEERKMKFFKNFILKEQPIDESNEVTVIIYNKKIKEKSYNTGNWC